MAKLHEMGRGAMHKQTMSHRKQHTRLPQHWVSMLSGRGTTNKQASTEKKGKGGVPATSVAADGASMSSSNKLGHGWAPSLQGILGAFGDTEGVREKVKVVHRSFSLQALTQIGELGGSRKAPTE